MAAAQFEKVRADVTKKLHEKNSFTDVLGQVEGKTGVDRFYLVSGVAGFFALYLIFGHFAELVCNFIGFVYPAYVSIKAIESHTKDDDTQWLTYWVVFALLNTVEFFSDLIIGWFPIYWLVKCAFMLYLYLPMTRGAQQLYVRFVRPFVQKHGSVIDDQLNKFKGMAGDAVNTASDEINRYGDKLE